MSKREESRAADKSDSEETIADLRRAVEDLVSRRKTPEKLQGIIDDAKALAHEWKIKESSGRKRPLFGSIVNDTTFLLAALVVALSPDHELLKRIRRYLPDKFKNISDASADAEFRAFVEFLPLRASTAEQTYERKRRRWRRTFFSSIEYQFGGAAQAERWNPLSAYSLPYEPMCLDDIFAGKSVNMQRLEELFAMDRHRLSEALQRASKPPYNYLDVVQIMNALLSEKRRKSRKRRGRSPRTPWLNYPDRRMHVLNGIMARIKSLSVQPNIANEFFTVIRPHVAESGKK
jgi:hypothetical protein